MQQLLKDARRLQAFTFASGTFDNYVSQWVKFLTFCVNCRLLGLPAPVETLLCYAQFLSSSLRSDDSLLGYVAGVKKLHVFLRLLTKQFNDFELKLTLQGLKRLNTHVVQQALPLTPALLEKIYFKLNFNLESDILFWCVSLYAFFLLFRKSNLVPDTLGIFRGQTAQKR